MSRAGFWAALAVVLTAAAGFGLHALDRPGLYYDEAIQAVPAVAFLAGEPPPAVPGRVSAPVAGRWLPVMTQPYMGALKSQLLIPVFALFDATPRTLRTATWAWTLLGVLLAALLARELLGPRSALLAAALLAADPCVLFVGRHDWGSFALAFACRSGGLLALAVGWRRDAAWLLALGGAALGLGVYNKLDFGVGLLAVALALLASAPRALPRALAAEPRRLAFALAGGLVGAAPMLVALPRAVAVSRAFAGGQSLDASEWSEKLVALGAVLDGSYFQQLMLAGGSFEALGTVAGVTRSPFAALLVLAILWLAGRLVLAPADDGRDPARRFLLAAALLAPLAVLLTPRAVRVHHFLGAVPFPHLLLAAALADAWRVGRRARALRVATVVAAGLALAGSLRVDLASFDAVADGGRGRWTSALADAVPGLAEAPGTRVVALDWGFAEPLRFLAPGLPVQEPIWRLRKAARTSPVVLEGEAGDAYLVYPDAYRVFPFGARLLDAVRRLPPGSAELRPAPDSEDPDFWIVRIARPHRLVYRGSFEVSLR